MCSLVSRDILGEIAGKRSDLIKQIWNIRRTHTYSTLDQPSNPKQLTAPTTVSNPIPNSQMKQHRSSSNPPLTSKSNITRSIDPGSPLVHANSVES